MTFRIMVTIFSLVVLLATAGSVVIGNGEWLRLLMPSIALFASIGLLYRSPMA